MKNKGFKTTVLLITIAFSTVTSDARDTTANCPAPINVNPDPHGEPWIAGGLCLEETTDHKPSLENLTFSTGKLSKTTSLPSRVDNSVFPQFRPIFTQIAGTCTHAASVSYIYTYEINSARGLSSDILANQYPYEYSYNLLGLTTGLGCIARLINDVGVPNAEIYGGFGLDNPYRWVSGYDVYKNAMSNRLKDDVFIRIETPEDLERMKRWLHDRDRGDPQGGLLFIGAQISDVELVTLAPGTPREGKHAIVQFGGSAGHALTIVGYDDSVRYDYNDDGVYENPTDDIGTWEIGAVKVANSWGTRWADSGFAYVTYRALVTQGARGASGLVSGLVIDHNEPYHEPRITYKISLTHENSNQVYATAGFARNTEATAPSFVKPFNFGQRLGFSAPLTDYDGGPFEYGVEVSHFEEGTRDREVAFFLDINTTGGSGTLHSFSVIDYTGTDSVEYKYPETDIELVGGTDNRFKLIRPYERFEVTSPKGGEEITQNNPLTIAWDTDVRDSVKVELIRADSVVALISNTHSDEESFEWVIPHHIPSDSNYSVRITTSEHHPQKSSSSQIFTIGPPSGIHPFTRSPAETPQVTVRSNSIGISGYDGTVEILTLKGVSVLRSESVNNSVTIDTSRLSGAVYLLKLQNHGMRLLRLIR
ncbi:Ser-Thr-rich GPI-anchored membrane family protein [Chitinispirillales bacterium ANBcel5]|uniref:Ser-Thr-rich GPI-anchored membrane family protein n=1 Tax=Cellulosispirillum alkaliphilum TaxID=3039283 RepID=UPI002A5677B8|nr:Ser-Thr-rich GPI-anchored membrane family protein [Chitinispirillales bacterium ANBcel5]